MTEVNKSSEELLGQAIVQGLSPVLKQMTDSIAELKSVNDANEAETQKAILEKLTALESKNDAYEKKQEALEKKNAELEAEMKEVKSSKAPADIAMMSPAMDFERLSYEIKSDAISLVCGYKTAISEDAYARKCVDYIKSFSKEHPTLSKKYSLGETISHLESKSFHNTADAAYGGFFLNAPFVLPTLVQVMETSVMRQYAKTTLSNSLRIEMPYVENIGEAEWVHPTQQSLSQNVGAFADLKVITAVEVAKSIGLASMLRSAASDSMPFIISTLETLLRDVIYRKFDTAYSGQGIKIVGGGEIEGIVPDADRQVEYTFANVIKPNGSSGNLQFEKNKLCFIKSGSATPGEVTAEAIMSAPKTLRSNMQITLMARADMILQMQTLKDSNGNLLYFNGNGAGLANPLPDRICGMTLVVNDLLPEGVAVYGDFTAGYHIIDCFGGFQMLERPATGTGLIDNIIGKASGSAMIQDFSALRLIITGV